MNISEPFIRRPIATTLLTAAVALAGAVAFRLLPVSPLPQVDFPTISVSASLPGASPETMASSVATPLERQFGHIASVTEMTSSSTLGASSITLQFDLNRNIDAAARDVQAAINAARGYLPANLPSNPSYRKVNPADAPIFMLALTSDQLTKGQMYDAASTIMAQKLSQVTGVGQVVVGGSALPGVRIELNPSQLNKYGIGFEQVRTFLAGSNANTPKGDFQDGKRRFEVGANDQIFNAIDYQPLVIAYHNGSAVHVSDVGEAVDSVEDLRNAGYANGKPSVLVIVFRQPGANIIDTVDQIRAVLPQLEASIPRAINVRVAMDQTVTIRASVHDVEITLLISIALVILVVFAFLRSGRTTFIPSIAVPVSLLGTFGVMYLAGFSIDNLSLMALTISTGFVVDDAIVVIENITRYIEHGMQPFQAALEGRAGDRVHGVHHQHLADGGLHSVCCMMGGIVGRLLREFAITLSVAILVSMVISLTTTPMMCAHLLRVEHEHGWFYRKSEQFFTWVVNLYGRTLSIVLRHPALTLMSLLATVALTIYLYIQVPKGFFPQQDTGRLSGQIQADQDTSFQTMDKTLLTMVNIIDQRSGHRHRERFLRRRRRHHHQYGANVHFPEAAGRTQGQCRPDHPAPAAQAGESARSHPLFAGRAGCARGRPVQQRAVSIHHARRQLERSDHVRSAHAGRVENHPHHHRRQQRSTGSGSASHGGVRPQDRRALQHFAGSDRRRALRRFRPAAGVHDVFLAQSISRGDGGRAAILAESQHAPSGLRVCARWQGSSLERHRENRRPPPRRCR